MEAARTTLSMDGGVNEISRGGETDRGWLGRLSVRRRTSTSLTLGAELGHDFSDSGNAFAELQLIQPGSTEPVAVQQTAAPFENNYGTIYAEFSRNRTDVRLRAGYYDESYQAQPLFDRKRTTLDLSLNRNLNAALSVHCNANYSRQEFESLDRKFTDLNATLGVRWGVGRSTSVSFDYTFMDRNDDASGADYRVNEVWVRFGYQVGAGAGDHLGGA